MDTFGQDRNEKRNELLVAVDNRVGAIRKCYVTDIPLQDTIYERKSEEAASWLNSRGKTVRSAAGYDMLNADVRAGIAKDLDEAAERIATATIRTNEVMVELEVIRGRTKKAIKDTDNIREMQAILIKMDEDLNAIRKKYPHE